MRLAMKPRCQPLTMNGALGCRPIHGQILRPTLIREDGHVGDVFSLLGPKRYDAAWCELEREGWIATVDCCAVQTD